jgi:uracil-DNA glycosylase
MWLLWGKKVYTTQIPHKTIFDVKNYSKETIEGIPTSPYFNYILKAAHPAAECYQAMQDFFRMQSLYYVNKILTKINKKSIGKK